MSGAVHERVLAALRSLPGAEGMEMPPPVFREMGGEALRADGSRAALCETTMVEVEPDR